MFTIILLILLIACMASSANATTVPNGLAAVLIIGTVLMLFAFAVAEYS